MEYGNKHKQQLGRQQRESSKILYPWRKANSKRCLSTCCSCENTSSSSIQLQQQQCWMKNKPNI